MKVIDSNVVLRVYKCENCKKTGICSVCGEGVVYKKGVCQDCYEYEAQKWNIILLPNPMLSFLKTGSVPSVVNTSRIRITYTVETASVKIASKNAF